MVARAAVAEPVVRAAVQDVPEIVRERVTVVPVAVVLAVLGVATLVAEVVQTAVLADAMAVVNAEVNVVRVVRHHARERVHQYVPMTALTVVKPHVTQDAPIHVIIPVPAIVQEPVIRIAHHALDVLVHA